MITIDNFHLKSHGHFMEIHAIPKGFELFYFTNSSFYYTNEDKDTLVRVSNHWGKDIACCSWYLGQKIKSKCWPFMKMYGKKTFHIGKVKFSKLMSK